MSIAGCAGQQQAGATASLGSMVHAISMQVRPTLPAEEQRAREEAIIARAIAEHEMRHP